MHIQVNTDHNIAGHEALTAKVRGVIESTLSQRCMLEARLEGRQPIAVTHDADTLDWAVDGAAEKLNNAIESTLGRVHGHRGARG